MAEAIAFDIVSNLATKLGAAAFREMCLMYGVEDELGKLKATLSTIEAALLDADQRKEESNLMQDWIRKLNDAVYYVDDVLDAFATKALRRQLNTDRRMKRQVREFFSSSNQLAFRYKMGHKIKEINEKFDEIAADMSKFNFRERLILQASVDNSDRETMSFVLTSEIIGREKDKEEIIKMLKCSSHEKVSVLSIVGMGGLGKSALIQLVYNDDEAVKDFELKMWVCVSDNFEIKSLVIKILNSTRKEKEKAENLENSELEQLQICLREKLDGKRFLLILDDIWNEIPRKWEPLKNLLMGGAKGSKIVVTTRSRTVASIMGSKNPYLLEGLSEKKSWDLFVKIAFRGHEKVHPNLEVIGKEIIERCKGVPLAIQSLASVMQLKVQESEWLPILNNSDIWLSCQDGDILPILKLSYDQLPMHLKQCFAYCSIFPKDHKIRKEELIQQWMAQGYLRSSNRSRCLEDIGDQYFMIFLSRSFFQEVETNGYNEVISCKMHDLIHDLAVKVAGYGYSIEETTSDNISERVHHASYVHNFTEFPRQLLKAKGLRTLSARAHSELIFSYFTYLRVLNLRNCFDLEVSDSIGKLQHLRYLDLSKTLLICLPNSISSLINLQTLKLSSCPRLEELPRGITKLIRLRCLMIDDCIQLDHVPTGLEKLTSLRRFSRFFMVERDERSLRLGESIKGNKLRFHLADEGYNFWMPAYIKAVSLEEQYMDSLTLEWGIMERARSKVDDHNVNEILLEGPQPHPELREVEIRGYSGKMFPSWMTMGNVVISFPNIVSMTLEDCHGCRHLPPSLDQLPFLKFLKLARMDRLEHIGDDEDNNNNLYLATSSSSSSSSSLVFPSLEELVFHDLRNLEGWWRRAAPEGRGTSSSTLSFPRMTRLCISYCPKLKPMPMHPPHIVQMVLSGVPKKLICQQFLPITTTTEESGSERVSSSSIPSFSSSFPFSKLRTLAIGAIKDLESLPEEVLQNLTSLEALHIQSCPLLSLVAMSEEEEEEEEEEGFFRGLTSLLTLHIESCDSLTSLSPPETQCLTALDTLTIQNCKNFNFSDDGLHWQGLRSLRRLVIENLPKLVSLPDGLHHVATLQRLEISECPRLTALPDWISNLSSLQMLYLLNCPLLSERCCREDWSMISHIPIIVIDEILIQGEESDTD